MNADADNAALLREFVELRSETAFATLVRQNLNFVYSVALRRCGGRTVLAEEVCQLVFIDLARQARALPIEYSVAGWLHQHTCFVAAKQLRTERRRERREDIAMQLRTLADETDWSRLAPVLDDSLLELTPPDREPLVQRFFGQQSFAQIGVSLGLSENAARMRVDRALEKLRRRLATRGITSTAEALGLVIAAQAVGAAPIGLGIVVTAASLAASASTASTFGLLSFLAMMKSKAAFAAILLLAVTVGWVFHQRTLQLRSENEFLRDRLEAATVEARLAAEKGRLAEDELDRGRAEQQELLKLRGELARLRGQVAKESSTASLSPPAQRWAETWQVQATLGLQETLLTPGGAWGTNESLLLIRPVTEEFADQRVLQYESVIITAPAELLKSQGLTRWSDRGAEVLSDGAAADLVEILEKGGATISRTTPTAPGAEGNVYVGFTEDDRDETLNFTLTPVPAADGRLSLSIAAERRQLSPDELQILREPDAEMRIRLREQLEARKP
ncbi:MAG: sigma-70 family RNA polymerase sigma factor [Verrucomicrobia bacterium]|nr:sigma-70 family RNA polymerase sigma factor [Verrucomicrobiota bacterium]